MALSRSTLSRPRLLVLRALGLGDLLTGVPALRALRHAYVDHELVLAAPRVLEPLVELAGIADRVLDSAGLSPVPWEGQPPGLAVNLHGKGPQSHRLLQALGPGRLVAFECAEASHDGPRWRLDEHEVYRWCRLLDESLRVAADPRDLGIAPPRTPAPFPGAVVVHPGAAFPARRWPAERFGAVARWAREVGYDVVVTGGPDEVSLAEQVRRAADLPASAVLAGRTGLTELAAQVASARLLVCGDTGVAHLASAFSTPSVVLFGPTPPSRWGPPPEGPHVVIWRGDGDGDGDPWGSEVDPALLRVQVDEVLGCAQRVME
jgi:ADP-heptose:LPS heptosyltransferase